MDSVSNSSREEVSCERSYSRESEDNVKERLSMQKERRIHYILIAVLVFILSSILARDVVSNKNVKTFYLATNSLRAELTERIETLKQEVNVLRQRLGLDTEPGQKEVCVSVQPDTKSSSPAYSRAITLFGLQLYRIKGGELQNAFTKSSYDSCYSFKGTTGRVSALLKKECSLSRIVISHSTETLKSSMREFTVKGRTEEEGEIELGKYVFEGCMPLQSFSITNKTKVKGITIEIESNNGSSDYTCVYLIEVYAFE